MPSRDAVAGVSRAAAHAIWMVSKKTRRTGTDSTRRAWGDRLRMLEASGVLLTSLTGVPT